MADWPKEITVRGIPITVSSWDELDEMIERYGTSEVPAGRGAQRVGGGEGQLTHTDRQMLQKFIQAPKRGMLNRELTGPLGVDGWGVKPKLDEWARRIGLAPEGGSAFEAVNMGRAGRGYRLTDLSMSVAKHLLGQEGGQA